MYYGSGYFSNYFSLGNAILKLFFYFLKIIFDISLSKWFEEKNNFLKKTLLKHKNKRALNQFLPWPLTPNFAKISITTNPFNKISQSINKIKYWNYHNNFLSNRTCYVIINKSYFSGK